MDIEIRRESLSSLSAYADIPIAFDIRSILSVTPDGSGGFALEERRLPISRRKDYDSAAGQRPAGWAERFDTSRWAVFSAHAGGARVGGAVVAAHTPGVTMLEGRRDLALLWDIRVRADARGRGAGSALFRAAEGWAAENGCRQLKIETQNVNVAACRFYARQGCVLLGANPGAYPELPDETQLLWYKDLGG
jgi:GNAT superfamily N-acetyltransferase